MAWLEAGKSSITLTRLHELYLPTDILAALLLAVACFVYIR